MNFNWEEQHCKTLLKGNAIIDSTSQSIARSYAVSIETEQMVTDVLSTVDEQKEKLLRRSRRLEETDAELNKTRRILNVMRVKVLLQRFILILIIILEVAILGIVIYFKFFHRK